MIIAVASRKASPGVTTLATLIAARWPGPEAVRLVLEADPSGGTLAARWSTAHGLTWEPGLLALSTSRRPATPATVVDVAQPVAEGLWVAAAPPGPDQVGAALTRLGEAGAEMLAAAPGLVTVADCGRLSVDSPALALARRAELTVLVCRPRLEEVHALVPAVAELVDAGCRLGLVTVGDEPYGPAEVAANLGLDLLGVVPVDGRAADLYLRQGLTAGRAFRRSAVAAAAADVVAAIAVRCPDPGAAVDAPASTSPPPSTPTLVAPSAPASTSASTSTPAVTSVAASGAGAPGAVASGPPVGPGPLVGGGPADTEAPVGSARVVGRGEPPTAVPLVTSPGSEPVVEVVIDEGRSWPRFRSQQAVPPPERPERPERPLRPPPWEPTPGPVSGDRASDLTSDLTSDPTFDTGSDGEEAAPLSPAMLAALSAGADTGDRHHRVEGDGP